MNYNLLQEIQKNKWNIQLEDMITTADTTYDNYQTKKMVSL